MPLEGRLTEKSVSVSFASSENTNKIMKKKITTKVYEWPHCQSGQWAWKKARVHSTCMRSWKGGLPWQPSYSQFFVQSLFWDITSGAMKKKICVHDLFLIRCPATDSVKSGGAPAKGENMGGIWSFRPLTMLRIVLPIACVLISSVFAAEAT